MNKRKLFFRSIVAIVVFGALFRYFNNLPDQRLFHVTGQTMGTIVYNAKYLAKDEQVTKPQIDSILQAFNQSLSTYIPNSEISRLNKSGELSSPSSMFREVMDESFKVYQTTNGAFDPTVGPLVNAWGFGPEKKVNLLDSATVKELLKGVGLNKILLSPERIKMDTAMYLDFSAIAKGYAVDLVAEYLEANEVTDYMVEIGGEVRAKGKNDKEKTWSIGIEDPLVAIDEQKLLAIVNLQDRSMATSGNYRNYYTVGDRIIAHTIDPRTGYNTHHNLLSASIFANDCMEADAFATAFMVLGLEASIKIVESSELEAFFVFQKEDGDLGSYVSSGLKQFVELNKAKDYE